MKGRWIYQKPRISKVYEADGGIPWKAFGNIGFRWCVGPYTIRQKGGWNYSHLWALRWCEKACMTLCSTVSGKEDFFYRVRASKKVHRQLKREIRRLKSMMNGVQ